MTTTKTTSRQALVPLFPFVALLLLALAALSQAYVLQKSTPIRPRVMSKPTYVQTWEIELEQHIRQHIQSKSTDKNDGRPYMIGICGIPGSGKSTSAEILKEILEDTGACIFPADGYHYTRATLETFPNALDALYRRGAPDTFDAASLTRDLKEIRHGSSAEVFLPGFDHGVGDPVEGQHHFRRDTNRVVICEGLYLLHASDGWGDVKDLFDFTVFVQADIDKCMQRLKIRNRVIPGYTVEEINVRVDAVDRANANLVEQSKDRAHLVVKSAAA